MFNNIKQYKILSPIKTNDYIKKYKCVDKNTNDIVVLNILNTNIDNALFFNNSSYIVKQIDCFKCNNQLIIIEEYENNYVTLYEFIKKKMYIKESDILKIVKQLLEFIKINHDNKIILNSVTYYDILINQNMEIKICNYNFFNRININKKYVDLEFDTYFINPNLFYNDYINYENDFFWLGIIMYFLALTIIPFYEIDNQKEYLINHLCYNLDLVTKTRNDIKIKYDHIIFKLTTLLYEHKKLKYTNINDVINDIYNYNLPNQLIDNDVFVFDVVSKNPKKFKKIKITALIIVIIILLIILITIIIVVCSKNI